MTKYKDYWEQAMSEMEERRLARSQYRMRSASSANPSFQLGGENDSPIQARFRRRNPLSELVTMYSIVFVNQSALSFGSRAVPPRQRRPVLVLRADPDAATILGAPFTTKLSKSYGLFRKLPIARDAVGLTWENGQPVDMFLYDGPEFIARKDIRMNEPDFPLAKVTPPLLQTVIDFIRGPLTPAMAVRAGAA